MRNVNTNTENIGTPEDNKNYGWIIWVILIVIASIIAFNVGKVAKVKDDDGNKISKAELLSAYEYQTNHTCDTCTLEHGTTVYSEDIKLTNGTVMTIAEVEQLIIDKNDAEALLGGTAMMFTVEFDGATVTVTPESAVTLMQDNKTLRENAGTKVDFLDVDGKNVTADDHRELNRKYDELAVNDNILMDDGLAQKADVLRWREVYNAHYNCTGSTGGGDFEYDAIVEIAGGTLYNTLKLYKENGSISNDTITKSYTDLVSAYGVEVAMAAFDSAARKIAPKDSFLRYVPQAQFGLLDHDSSLGYTKEQLNKFITNNLKKGVDNGVFEDWLKACNTLGFGA